MVHIVIGLIVGMVMGLTGAGGALISIPLFMYLLDTSLKEATILSLIAVLFGTSVNLLGNLTKVDKKIVIYFAVFGTIANIFSMGLKGGIPEIVIAGLLCVIGIYSIWSVWQNSMEVITPTWTDASFIKLIVTGLFLGLITTLTGLGGGVILVPILIKYYGKTYADALPTSLATIFLVSLSSFLLQGKAGFALITITELVFIGLGAILGFYLLKKGLKMIGAVKIIQTRKSVFTLVTVYSILSVLLKAS